MYSMWASFRAAFGALDVPDLQGTVEAMSRHQLLDEKQALLENLKDLRFDREAGKLSQKDFEKLDTKLRERAKEVLRLLDADVKPFRRKAEALIEKKLKKREKAPYRKTSKPLTSRKECPKCDTTNDGDAAFCKKCGHNFDELEGDDARIVLPEEVEEVLGGLDAETAKKARKVLEEAGLEAVKDMLAEDAEDESSEASEGDEDADDADDVDEAADDAKASGGEEE